ncbi:GtrA family protein [uncultured Propionibacterium sp.]|uniref:GtrA family protein n=1 Tax=uncultured Propionibacterium sp. TaxID=218066 RepID=UPI00292D46C2|nr:GtrA family protein [uncultured Propionibacterium sp.]
MSNAPAPDGATSSSPDRLILGKPLSAWWRFLRQLISYGLLGGLGAISDFLIYTGMVHFTPLSHVPVAANMISVLTGILVSFLLNSRITFRTRDNIFKRGVRFFTVGLSGLALSTSLLAILTHGAGMDPIIAKLITMPPVVLFQFLANRFWSFRTIEGTGRKNSRFSAANAPAWTLPIIHGALLTIVLAVYVVLFVHEARSGLEFDEAYNLEVARNLAAGDGYATYGWRTGTTLCPFDPFITTGPSLLLPAGLLWRISNGTLWFVRLVPLSYFSLFLFSIWRLAYRNLNRWAALATLCSPLLIHVAMANDLLTQSLTVGRFVGEFTAVTFIFAAVLALSSKDRTFLAGLMAGLAVQTKANFVEVGFTVMLSWLVARWTIDRRFPLRKALLGVLGAILPTVLFEVYVLVSLGSYTAWRRNLDELLEFVSSQSTAASPHLARFGGLGSIMSLGGYLVLGLAIILLVTLAMVGGARAAEREQRAILTALFGGVLLGAGTLLYTWIMKSTQDSPRQGMPTIMLGLPIMVMAMFAAFQSLRRSTTAWARFWFWAEKIFCLLMVAFAAWQGMHEAASTTERQRLIDQRAAAAYLDDSGVTPSIPNYGMWHVPEILILSDVPTMNTPGVGPPTVDVMTSHMAMILLGTEDARDFRTPLADGSDIRCTGEVLFSSQNVLICSRP